MSKLTLIATPISDEVQLNSEACALLKKAVEKNDLVVVEEHKVARRRWIKYGLPREAIDNFILYNEHNYQEQSLNLLKSLQQGKNVYLMSDCGLPAFCDPGRQLVDLCHQHDIQVTASPFSNSIGLAIALSGFNHHKFLFEGFIPVKNPERKDVLKSAVNNNYTTVIMDTPYRLSNLLKELMDIDPKHEIFLACDLNKVEEEVFRGQVKDAYNIFNNKKKEFILLIKGKA